jgi:vacuolar-type H+-ATPase subunit E/Vma4
MEKEYGLKEYGDASHLAESVFGDAKLRIEEIRRRTLEEMERIETEYLEEMRKFSEKIKEETDMAISRTLRILRNRSDIEKRKLQLKGIDDFTRVMAMKGITDFQASERPGYISLLKKSLAETLPESAGDIIIHISAADAMLESPLRDAISAGHGFRGKLSFIIDESITCGGLLIEDRSKRIIYNLTLDRLLERAYDGIRKKAADSVLRHLPPDDRTK